MHIAGWIASPDVCGSGGFLLCISAYQCGLRENMACMEPDWLYTGIDVAWGNTWRAVYSLMDYMLGYMWLGGIHNVHLVQWVFRYMQLESMNRMHEARWITCPDTYWLIHAIWENIWGAWSSINYMLGNMREGIHHMHVVRWGTCLDTVVWENTWNAWSSMGYLPGNM